MPQPPATVGTRRELTDRPEPLDATFCKQLDTVIVGIAAGLRPEEDDLRGLRVLAVAML